MAIVSDPGLSRKKRQRAILVALTILILFPIGFIQDTNARSIVQTSVTDATGAHHLHRENSGFIPALFKTEPASSTTNVTGAGQASDLPSPGTVVDRGTSSIETAVSATQSSSSISLLSGFDGLSQIQSCPCVPPDVQLATGPTRIVEMVNLEGEIFTKQGVSNQTFSLSTFFGTGSDSITDPKVVFDAVSGRWFTSLSDFTASRILLGVSSTNDPSQQWVIFSVSVGGDLPDQPILGISDDKVGVAANDYVGNTFVGSQFWIINKSQLIAGINANFFTSGADSGVFSVHPVQSLSSTTTQFMVSNIVAHRSLSTTSLRLFSVTGIPGVSTVSITTNDLTISAIGTLSGGALPGGVQPGTSSTVNTNDFRLQDALWFKGTIWLGFDDACTPTGDVQLRSCVRLIKMDTSGTPLVSQDVDYGIRQMYTFYPAMRVDDNGNLLMVYGYSNGTLFPSIAITGQLATDPANSLAPPLTLKPGTAADTSTRYGDYFGAALDPSDPSMIWVAGEYHDSSTGSCQTFGSCWSTFISSASMTGFTVSASPASIRLSAISPAGSNVTFSSVNGFSGLLSTNSSKVSGITMSPPQPVSLASGGTISIRLSFSVVGTLSTGNYSVTVTASNGTISRTTKLVLTVFPDYYITFACSCFGTTISPSNQLRENITLTGVNGFTGVIGLKPSILPLLTGGPSLSFNQANQTLSQAGAATATLLVSSGNVTGTFTIAVTGSCLSGSCVSPVQQHSIDLLLTVFSSTSSSGAGGGGRDLRF